MSTIHPYIKYAHALLLVENNLADSNEIIAVQIKNEIDKGLNSFRVKPSGIFDGKSSVK